MSAITAFFKALMPNFTKSELADSVSSAYDELSKVRDLYNLDPLLFKADFKQSFPELNAALARQVPDYKGNMVRSIFNITKARSAELNDILDYVDNRYGRVVFKDALDLQNVNVMRYIDAIVFFNEYARRLLLVGLNNIIEDSEIVTPVDFLDRDFVSNPTNVTNFALACGLLSKSFKETTGQLEAYRNIQFNPETQQLVEKQNPKYLMSTKQYMPVVGSLFLMLGKMRNRYLSNRLEAAKMEQEKLQLQVLLLRRKSETVTDSEEIEKLRKQISYYNNRLNKIHAVIEDLREDAL